MTGRSAIPAYRLYGEDRAWPMPELLHHESIAERSRLHEWTIRPHRHPDLFQLLYIRSGSAVMALDGAEATAGPPCLVMIPPVCVHGFTFSRDIDGHVVTFPDFVLRNYLSPVSGLLDKFTSASIVDDLDVDRWRELDGHFGQLAGEYTANDPARLLALEARLGLILALFARAVSSKWEDDPAVADRGTRHLQRFQELIEENFRHWLPVEDYAASIGITATQLNNVCRARTAKSALQHVHERVLLEAKRSLIYTAMTISEIAYALGFSDPAYFSRFFTKRAGLPPTEFRMRRITAMNKTPASSAQPGRKGAKKA